ncbi:MAG: GH92 family glycosyl hydrolase [Bacteroidetes bacterium]|nr:GH92 family glycosyl hydrolase [Bacteroidota bacterium]
MNSRIFLFSIFLFATYLQAQIQFVNPFIGTGGHGHTFPGATSPFGMVQLSPDTRIDGSWDGCSGYHYSDSIIYGFSHTHLSGTGVSDYGDVLLMPMQGNPKFHRDEYKSNFDHKEEKANPGYYSVLLKKEKIQAEFTSSTRVGLHHYTFPKIGPASIILDLQHRDHLEGFEIQIISKTKLVGYRKSGSWAAHEQIYFAIEFSQPFLKSKFHENKSKAGFTFLMKNKKDILVKVAISFTSIEGALANLQTEMPEWNFENTLQMVQDNWKKELGKIDIQGTETEKIKFYSALYHCMIHPNVANDVDGKYRGMDNQIHEATGFNYYTVFSLWDTYRALHPLLTIIDRKRTADFIQTFLKMYEEGGRLPVWELAGNETDCMIGYHCASVIADAWIKGIRGFDSALALKAMMDISNENKYGKHAYIHDGFISAEMEPESVSKTLEYAYDDWCISEFAKSIGESKIADRYFQRSNQWRNLFDPETGFIRPRYNGNWLKPFDPREVNNHFTEANCWQYSFYVPQNIHGLMQALGGVDAMGNKLDLLFADKSGTSGREQSDITGLIGQYAHGNEPSHHMAYLYNYIYMPEKTQNLIHYICKNFYTTEPDGLIGNEDCGQMSAWYVLSAMGLYQVTPGFPYYTLGTPSVASAEIYLENGNHFRIQTSGKSDDAFFSSPVFEKERVMFLPYNSLQSEGVLQFQLSVIPEENNTDYLLPPLPVNNTHKPAPPLIEAPRSFSETTMVFIKKTGENEKVFYYLNSDSLNPVYYRSPFEVRQSCTIHAFSVYENGVETVRSFLSDAHLFKQAHNWKINLINKPNPQYTAGGDQALTDGIRGTVNWRAGDWQGYQNHDLEVILDLGTLQLVNEVSAGFLQDTRAWIFMPKKLEVYFSADGNQFSLVSTINNPVSETNSDVTIQNLTSKIPNPKKCRFVKIKAISYGKLPSWHAGYPYNGTAFIFVDEIEIR